MGDDIGSGLSSKAVSLDFRSTNVVELSNWNPYFYRFRCHHPLITQLTFSFSFVVVNLIPTWLVWGRNQEYFLHVALLKRPVN